MERFLILAAAAAFAAPALAADVGVSVSIGQPGFYGRLDIGGYPPPQVIYSQPMVVERISQNRPPVYIRVPPGHVRNWKKHCHEYNACGERVFFVQDKWYNNEYVPRYQKQHRNSRDNRDGGRKDEDREGDQGERGDHGNQRADDRRGDHGGRDDNHDRGRGH